MTDLEPVRFLLTISREWQAWTFLRLTLRDLSLWAPGATMVHGDAPRGDRQAAAIWRDEFGGLDDPWPAGWEQCAADCRHAPRFNRAGKAYCPVAGFRRNAAMVNEGRCAFALAFIHEHSRGATDCAKRAKAAGLRLDIHRNR